MIRPKLTLAGKKRTDQLRRRSDYLLLMMMSMLFTIHLLAGIIVEMGLGMGIVMLFCME